MINRIEILTHITEFLSQVAPDAPSHEAYRITWDKLSILLSQQESQARNSNLGYCHERLIGACLLRAGISGFREQCILFGPEHHLMDIVLYPKEAPLRSRQWDPSPVLLSAKSSATSDRFKDALEDGRIMKQRLAGRVYLLLANNRSLASNQRDLAASRRRGENYIDDIIVCSTPAFDGLIADLPRDNDRDPFIRVFTNPW